MRAPKPRGEVQGVSEPPRPRHKLSSNQIRTAVVLADNFRRKVKSIQSLPRTGGKVEAPGLEKKADGFQFRKLAGTQEIEDACRCRPVPGIRGQNKKYQAQLLTKVQLANGDPECNKHYYQGSSSSPPYQMMMVDCCICMQSKPLFKFFAINGCKHSYCSRCLGSYIKAKVNMNVTMIRCPDPACKDGKLEPLACKLIITKKVFDRWCDGLSEATIVVKFYCPFKDCSALLIDERGQEVIQESECPHCHRLFCAHCRVPWHSGLSCRKFLEMDKLGREKAQDKMLMEMAQKSKWQRCPKCKFYVERTDGCMFIKCRCGSTFCYGCASEMDVDHYCQKCKR